MDILQKRQTLDQIQKIQRKKNLKHVIADIIVILIGIAIFIGMVIALSYNI